MEGLKVEPKETHELFRRYFDKRKRSSPGYSLRVLARQTGHSPSFLSRILRGKKSIPYATVLKLGRALDVEPELLQALAAAHRGSIEGYPFQRQGKARLDTPVDAWDLADKGAYRALKQWYYLALLELTTLDGFDGSAASAARRLGIAPQAAEVALRELAAWGLLAPDEAGRLRKAKNRLRWTAAKPAAEIRAFHLAMLGKAKQELLDATAPLDFSRRLIAGITVTASRAKIDEAKAKLARCLHEIANDLIEAADGNEVYHLAAQLFPLTKAER
jgi:uncharacterized protein (TIGR02147 family)